MALVGAVAARRHGDLPPIAARPKVGGYLLIPHLGLKLICIYKHRLRNKCRIIYSGIEKGPEPFDPLRRPSGLPHRAFIPAPAAVAEHPIRRLGCGSFCSLTSESDYRSAGRRATRLPVGAFLVSAKASEQSRTLTHHHLWLTHSPRTARKSRAQLATGHGENRMKVKRMYSQNAEKSIPIPNVVHYCPTGAERGKAKARRRHATKEQRRGCFQAVRIGDLNKLYRHRYGGEFYVFPADDDAGREDLRILLDHYSYANPARMQKVAALRAPWLTGAELDDFLDEVSRFPRIWKAQDLGDHMNLTEAERCMLGIRTIGSIDMTPRQRRLQRKARDKERKASERRAKGAKPHEESAARLEPWKALKMSRAKYYRLGLHRRRETGETDSSTVNLFNTADESVSLPSKQRARPYQGERLTSEVLRIRPPLQRNDDQSGSDQRTGTHVPAPAILGLSLGQRLEISDSCAAEPVSPEIWRKAA
jgi:hypothetical protein